MDYVLSLQKACNFTNLLLNFDTELTFSFMKNRYALFLCFELRNDSDNVILDSTKIRIQIPFYVYYLLRNLNLSKKECFRDVFCECFGFAYRMDRFLVRRANEAYERNNVNISDPRFE